MIPAGGGGGARRQAGELPPPAGLGLHRCRLCGFVCRIVALVDDPPPLDPGELLPCPECLGDLVPVLDHHRYAPPV